MKYLSENDQYINVNCENCQKLLQIEWKSCSLEGDGYKVNYSVKCDCGSISTHISRPEASPGYQHQEEIKRVKLLNQTLQNSIVEYENEVEEYISSKSNKWEFVQVDTKDKNWSEKISELGLSGWEMVGITSFTEGMTFGKAGSYVVHFLYAFKRQLLDLSSELLEKRSNISELQKQISSLKSK